MAENGERDGEDGPGVDWAIHLVQVERLDREDDDEGADFFSVDFELSGLGMPGMLRALVTDPVSEATSVAEGLQQLQAALGIYARVVEAVEMVLREALTALPGRGGTPDHTAPS